MKRLSHLLNFIAAALVVWMAAELSVQRDQHGYSEHDIAAKQAVIDAALGRQWSDSLPTPRSDEDEIFAYAMRVANPN